MTPYKRDLYRTMDAKAFFELTRIREARPAAYVSKDSDSDALERLYRDGYRLHSIEDGNAVFSKVLYTRTEANPFKEGPVCKS